jgi:hypothetical protein
MIVSEVQITREMYIVSGTLVQGSIDDSEY